MSDDSEKLERLMDRMLREQPPRSAPPGLQSRVLEEIRARHAPGLSGGTDDLETERRPWWRRGFSHWPVAARMAFLAASFGFARLAIAAFAAAIGALQAGGAAAPALNWLQTIVNLCSAAAATGNVLIGAIPPAWLYASAGFGAVLYLALFGLGTVAYRALYVER